jgi:hypothetical protein
MFTLDVVERQARRYGEQIRLIEKVGTTDDRMRLRTSWYAFLRQFGANDNLGHLAQMAFADAYSRV